MLLKNWCNKFKFLAVLLTGFLFFLLKANAEVTSVCLPPSNAPLTPELRTHIAQWLDWENFTPSEEKADNAEKGCAQNYCGGAYREKPLEGFTAQLPNKDDARVAADEALLLAEGRSELKGNVVVIQPNRELVADTAYIYRDPKTKEITQIDLFGHVMVREPGKVMYGDEGHLLPEKDEGYVDNGLYRIQLTKYRQLESNELLQAWGRAGSIEKDKERYYLKNVSYTTCPPEDSAWQIEAKEMTLDKETGRGEVKDAFLDFHNQPIFYFPYYNFPIDDRRQSGFLVPTGGYSSNLGFNLGVPYYWNMAPNYDMLITPSYYSKRGMDLSTDFRYLTEISTGELSLSGIYHDKAFEQYIEDNEAELGGTSDNRYEIFFKDHSQFNPNWSANVHYHKVSDDYYLQDLGTNISETTENQLLQQADLDFKSDHWSSVLMMQNYQTLHPINQTAVADVYTRAPGWALNGNYGDLPGGLNFFMNNQYDNFTWSGDDDSAQALGDRYHISPIFSRPMISQSGYIKPMFQVQETYYGLSQNPTDLDKTMNILAPQTSVDSSLYFDRSTYFLGKDWTQTLEPRFYYLYVPYVNQTEVPNFDSAYNIFTYDQLFRNNRFSGLDRVGDANQFSLAMMSRFLEADSGTEKFHWGIGQTYYFEDRKVQLMQQESPDEVYADPTTSAGYMSPTDTYSPIASQISYHLTPAWSLVGDGAWDPNTSETNNATVNLHFQPGINQIINLGYSFLVNGDQSGITDTEVQDDNLNQTIFSFAWPLTPNHQWSTFGTWTQNISHNYPMNYSAGVQYEDCCWAVRFLGGKLYTNLDEDNNPVYNNSVYIQILLKGLGNVASPTPTSIIGNIPGYQDVFAK